MTGVTGESHARARNWALRAPVMPKPSREVADGELAWLSAGSVVEVPSGWHEIAEFARGVVRGACGTDDDGGGPGEERAGRGAGPNFDEVAVRVLCIPNDVRLGSEGYRLHVGDDGIAIECATPAGAFYALQSLRMLLPPDALRSVASSRGPAPLRRVDIEDRPRFAWRGLHVDLARHIMAKHWLLRLVDLMALHKLNVLHLHLSDDQGWRVEIKARPRLTAVGAWRRETMAGLYSEERYDAKPYGGYYTQADLREIVAYAAQRHVRVLPEIDMPGHMTAAIAAYPCLGNTDQQLEVMTSWGIATHVLNAEDRTVEFFEEVIDELLDVFPDTYFHVGGDECPKQEWRHSARSQQLISQRGLAGEEGLQSWFIGRLDRHLQQRHRRLVGWDEILEGGLSPGATVMSWRGEEGGIAAATAGHDVVMSPQEWTYFDLRQSSSDDEPLGPPVALRGYIDLERAYSYEPLPEALGPGLAPRVLGAQAALWTEYVSTAEHAEYMLFPRLCAFAETVWCSEKSPYGEFVARLVPHLERLDSLGVCYRPLDGPSRGLRFRW